MTIRSVAAAITIMPAIAKQHERVVLAGRDAGALEVGHRHQHDDDAGDAEQQQVEEERVAVERERAVEACSPAGRQQARRRDRGHDEADERRPSRAPRRRRRRARARAARAPSRDDERRAAGRASQSIGGQRRAPPSAAPRAGCAARRVIVDRDGARPGASRMRATSAFTDGSMRPQERRRVDAHHDDHREHRHEHRDLARRRSSSVAFSSWRTGPKMTRWNIHSM